MGKGEIARYEQFLLFPQCFQKACFPGASKGVIVLESVKSQKCLVKGRIHKKLQLWESLEHVFVPIKLTHSHLLMGLARSLLKTLWEKEKLLVQAISPSPTMFSTLSVTEIIILVTFDLSSANTFHLVWSKILSCGNGLTFDYEIHDSQISS